MKSRQAYLDFISGKVEELAQIPVHAGTYRKIAAKERLIAQFWLEVAKLDEAAYQVARGEEPDPGVVRYEPPSNARGNGKGASPTAIEPAPRFDPQPSRRRSSPC